MCTSYDPCADVTCAAGQVCIDGVCIGCSSEVCDGFDNDCDGLIDEGCGLPCSANNDCPAGQYCMNGQCTAYDPCADVTCAAGETCIDGVCVACGCQSDADCDDGNPVTIDYCFNCQCSSEVCVDIDADGYCEGEDCNDADASINPGARDICEDGMDNDCDGLVDEGCGLACASNSDCPAGMVCMNGVCVQG
jgi:Cys-rich repeat protein